jgi:hypothetical protein
MVDGFAVGSFRDGSEGANGHWEFTIINEGAVFHCRDEMFTIPKLTTVGNAMELLCIRRIAKLNRGWGSVGMMEQGQDVPLLHALKGRR